MIELKYYAVTTSEYGLEILRAKNKREAIEYLELIEISWFDIKPINEYANDNLGVGMIGFIENR